LTNVERVDILITTAKYDPYNLQLAALRNTLQALPGRTVNLVVEKLAYQNTYYTLCCKHRKLENRHFLLARKVA